MYIVLKTRAQIALAWVPYVASVKFAECHVKIWRQIIFMY
jgi:hypothetical protein